MFEVKIIHVFTAQYPSIFITFVLFPFLEQRNDAYHRALNDDFREDVYLLSQKEACRRNSIVSCWTYNSLTFLQSFLQPLPSGINNR